MSLRASQISGSSRILVLPLPAVMLRLTSLLTAKTNSGAENALLSM